MTSQGIRRLLHVAASGVVALTFLTGVATAADKKLRIIFVSSLGPAQPFYLPILKGFDLAGKQLDIETVFRGNQDSSLFSDPAAEKRLLQAAIATKPDGLIVSDTFPDVLAEDIKGAVAAGIPVVLTNTGFGHQKEVGALAFVGTDEHALGEIGASKLVEAGAKNVLVITTPPGAVPFVDERMDGIAKGIGSQKTTIVHMPLEQLVDQTKVVNTMVASVQKDPTIDAIFSLGSCCGPAMVAAREQLGDKAASMHFGTIDLGAPVIDALKSGKVEFAIDQQQFLEGYMPVVILANYLRYAISPVDDFYQTGPGLVTKDIADKVNALTADNFR
ncbi:MAG TPA: substrate-binding domain-containing protein [Bauldia sp.]|nr:substrate-binding domain-containing protein [Bauldia sp.]